MIHRWLLLALLLVCGCHREEPNGEIAIGEELKPVQLLEGDSFWSYRTADVFADGGSVAMGFINSNGEVIYVLFDYSLNMEKAYRPCFLQRTYNDADAVEIGPGTELESKVLTFIESARTHEELEDLLPSRKRAIEILKTRSLDMQIVGPARVVPMKHKMPNKRMESDG